MVQVASNPSPRLPLSSVLQKEGVSIPLVPPTEVRYRDLEPDGLIRWNSNEKWH